MAKKTKKADRDLRWYADKVIGLREIARRDTDALFNMEIEEEEIRAEIEILETRLADVRARQESRLRAYENHLKNQHTAEKELDAERAKQRGN
jgi:Ni,Fe-hydrogenase III large subunit